MRSILIYSSSSLLRQTNPPCAKQAFLDGLLPHGQGRVRSSPSCQFLGSDAVPGPIRPRWERAVQPRGVRVARGRPCPVSNAGSTAGTCQEELCAAGSPAALQLFPAGCGRAACSSGHGHISTGRQAPEEQPGAGGLACVTAAQPGTPPAQGGGTQVPVGTPGWPDLKGAPKRAEKVGGRTATQA